jgi:hypothetical protein
MCCCFCLCVRVSQLLKDFMDFHLIWCRICAVGGYPIPVFFQFPIVGTTNMADVRMCEVGVLESSNIDSLSKQLIARESFTPFICNSDLAFYICQMWVGGPFISKYYSNSVAVSCQTICTFLWLRTWELSILLLIILSLDCFGTQE